MKREYICAYGNCGEQDLQWEFVARPENKMILR